MRFMEINRIAGVDSMRAAKTTIVYDVYVCVERCCGDGYIQKYQMLCDDDDDLNTIRWAVRIYSFKILYLFVACCNFVQIHRCNVQLLL